MDLEKLKLLQQFQPTTGVNAPAGQLQLDPELAAGMQALPGAAPAGPSVGAAVGGAGIQGAGQAFSMIMNALAQQQALAARADMNNKDIASSEKITHGRMAQQDADFNANQRVAAVRNLLDQFQKSRGIASGSVNNNQQAASGLSSGIMQAFKGK